MRIKLLHGDAVFSAETRRETAVEQKQQQQLELSLSQSFSESDRQRRSSARNGRKQTDG